MCIRDSYDTVNTKFIMNMGLDEEDKKLAKENIESGEWITTYNASEQHREHIKQRFYENEKDIYVVLYNAMVSIDAPKTLYFPSTADMEIINKKYGRKAWFLQYRENKEDVIERHYEYTSGLLDNFTKVINQQLLDEIEDIPTRFENRARKIQEKLVNGDYNINEYSSCSKSVLELYTPYTNEREVTDKIYRSQKKKLKNNKKNEEEE